MAFVSVLIPAFNAAATIAAAVRSAQRQTAGDLEIIVIDDASSDCTVELVDELGRADPRVKLIRLAQNGGPGIARNAGLAAAGGRWIALLDADDTFHPDRLATLLRVAGEYRTEMAADNLSLVRAPKMTREGSMFSAELLPAPRLLGATEFVTGNTHRAGSARIGYGYLKPIINADFLRSSGIRYHSARFSEDYLFALECLLAGARYVISPDATYDYTVSGDGLTIAHSAADLATLGQLETMLLSRPAVSTDPALDVAMRRHIRAVDLARSWFEFATAIKRRNPAAALAQAFRSPDHLKHISSESLRAIPRALAHIRHQKPA